MIICCFAFAVYGQSSSWKSTRIGKVSLKYPPTWHTMTESHEGQTAISLTPDSMRNLHMQIFQIYKLPQSGNHNYAAFKKDFTEILRISDDSRRILKTEEISFKNHKTMHAEMIQSSLPGKVYAIDAGTDIYIVVFLQRRYSNTPDPKIERDVTAILNSITIDQ